MLTEDEPVFRGKSSTGAAARLLPSGDTFFLLWGADRELLVQEAKHRASLWTTRVWPGALLVKGEIAGVMETLVFRGHNRSVAPAFLD